jgi:acyl dehydratase
MAKDFGFPRPILHGLCSYGIAGWVFTRDFANLDPGRLSQLDVRFTSPVFPGETLDFDLWHESDAIAFRARVAARNVTCLDDGRCVIKPAK